MDFKEATEFAKQLADRMTNEELLSLYGIYKQITCGNCNISCPYIFQIKERAKWVEWNSHKDKSIQDLKKNYIKLVEKYLEKYSVNYGKF